MTEFVMVKGNLQCRTRNLDVVEKLQQFGWKVKQSTLGELL